MGHTSHESSSPLTALLNACDDELTAHTLYVRELDGIRTAQENGDFALEETVVLDVHGPLKAIVEARQKNFSRLVSALHDSAQSTVRAAAKDAPMQTANGKAYIDLFRARFSREPTASEKEAIIALAKQEIRISAIRNAVQELLAKSGQEDETDFELNY